MRGGRNRTNPLKKKGKEPSAILSATFKGRTQGQATWELRTQSLKQRGKGRTLCRRALDLTDMRREKTSRKGIKEHLTPLNNYTAERGKIPAERPQGGGGKIWEEKQYFSLQSLGQGENLRPRKAKEGKERLSGPEKRSTSFSPEKTPKRIYLGEYRPERETDRT